MDAAVHHERVGTDHSTDTNLSFNRSSTTARSELVPAQMPEPTLGCQIAPHYDHEQWPYNSDSDPTDSESDAESSTRAEVADEALAIEKAETQHSRGVTPALSKLNTQRSGRSRRDVAQKPVGFWDWQMVREKHSKVDPG